MILKKMDDFNNYISENVILFEKQFGLTHERIASYLGVSESFIKQVSSSQYDKHYNIYHLWKLAQLFSVNVDQLLPPLSNFAAFKKVRPDATEENYEKFIKKYQSLEEF